MLNPKYSGRTTHTLVREVVTSDEHRAICQELSDVSYFAKPKRLEKAVLGISMSEEQEKRLHKDLDWVPMNVQAREISNTGMMAMQRSFVSSSKGEKGLVGGKKAVLLNYSKLCAVPRDGIAGEKNQFVTIVLMRLDPVGGANANFGAALEGGGRVKKNLVVGIARVENEAIKDMRLSFCGMMIAFNP